MRRFMMLAALTFSLVAGQMPSALAQGATPAASPPSMNQFLDLIKTNQTCAWPVELSVNALNVGLPDKNSVYFILPYVLSPGQSFIVKGAFPLDRFTSINTYDRRLTGGTGLDLLGWLPDYAIAPDAGSANPATDPNASTDPAHRRWTVRIAGSASPSVTPTAATPVAGQNVLPAMPTGVENVVGVLIMRIYVPTDANDPTGGVGLPSITLEEASGASRALTECTAADREVWKSFFTPFATQIIEEAPQLPTPPSVDAQPQWLQTTFPGLGTNPDNRYLMVPIAWKPGRVVVVRGKAPTFPNTRAGDPVTKPAQLRYWSFCTGSNVPPLITADCASDFETAIAADGAYTLVVSQPGDKPANATADRGVTWLKGGDPNQPDILFERHLRPSPDFYAQSVWNVPEGVPGAAASVMGPYYPQIVYCDKATFESGGADACFAAATPIGSNSTPAA